MGDKSEIEWTDATWPIVQGCWPKSPGCANCYAPAQLWRQAHNPNPKVSLPVVGLVDDRGHFTGRVALREDRLDWPLRWTRPRMIFVPSLGDLFYGDDDDRRQADRAGRPFTPVPDEFLHRVFEVMEHCPHHTFQVLTKRVGRMRDYLNWRWGGGRIPSRHIWIGASVEDQQRADERIELLVDTIAAVRFLSAEPLLGPIDLTRRWRRPPRSEGEWLNAIECGIPTPVGIDWVIAGGESGNRARPMHPDWPRSLRDQCQAAGVAFFFKQWGEHEWAESGHPRDGWLVIDATGTKCELFPTGDEVEPRVCVRPVGKKKAGRQLDGREWSEFPSCARVAR